MADSKNAAPWYRSENETQNAWGEWVPAIPEPLYGLRKRCMARESFDFGTVPCKRKFWTKDGYRAHYALIHVLGLTS